MFYKQTNYLNKFAIYFLFNAIFIINDTNAQWTLDDHSCRTPDNALGTCIPIKTCTHIINFITNSPKPLSAEATRTLKAYQCGFEGNQVKVCCPESPIPIIPNQQNGIVNNQNPPDVTGHKNLNLLSLENCGPLNEDRIIVGNRTWLFEYPWMALLSYQTSKGVDFHCGGTIINERYILTAAHCITNLGTSKLLGVRVGEHDTSTNQDCEDEDYDKICAPPVQDLAIDEIIPHPDYNTTTTTIQHDIGLIRLASPINLKVENAKAVCLPVSPETRNLENKTATITGWGATETGRKSTVLLRIKLPIIPFDDCKNIYSNQANLTFRQMCAGGKNRKDSCLGDSGGPLHLIGLINEIPKVFQHGIESFGTKICATEEKPVVYTRITYYLDWILDNMRP